MSPRHPHRTPEGEWATIERHGHSYRIRNSGGRMGYFISRGYPYEKPMLDYIWRLGLTGSALDVGAHIGNHALFLAAVCGLTVHAIEPGDRPFRLLVENMEANPTLRDRLFAHRLAAGAEPGHGVLNAQRAVEPADRDWEFAVARIDDVFDLPDLVLVKIDVEGGEPDVLAGMAEHLARSAPIVFSETHSRSARRAQAAVLHPLGYRETAEFKMGSPMVEWRRTEDAR